jgi:CTP:molybdopterin cytidylyltransferase MocA
VVPPARIAGLLLAAGSGRRYGLPKALVDDGSGPWVLRALDALAGCDPRVVVVGARGDEVAALLPADVLVVDNPGYDEGMGSSLRLGLTALTAFNATGFNATAFNATAFDATAFDATAFNATARPRDAVPADPVQVDAEAPVDAAVVMLVDLPGIGAEVIRRVSAAAGTAQRARTALARASFDGVRGHPVLLGREHWPGVIESAVGDAGARSYLRAHPAVLVECADIGSGEDVDLP